MQTLLDIGIVVLGYLLGSVPFGFLIVKFKTGKDIRDHESGRTGGTNAMRAAGFSAGLMTALMDFLKGAATVWIAQALTGNHWVHALAPIGGILGHNYSIYLPEFDEQGHFKRLRGGAGGAPALGGTFGLWPASILIILPLAALMYFTLGYASVATMSVPFFAIIIFAIRAYLGAPGASWVDVSYGVLAEVLLIWALRPNIKKLLMGTERVVSISLAGRLKARREQREAASGQKT